ncbi:hypothetical protein IW261DRAFT_1488515 [Armillaria novae-zelandiae]|uniref:Uncharacterized protein n=1 Tax=Armillaria novae-zelandiae TaxID=153914 RepID=A0AA39UFT1_9AGAR|nr:hypothetical protein IW261DRAFT_1488515 [Armillaria novae-zelandiae]
MRIKPGIKIRQAGMRLQYQRDPNGCSPSVIIVDNPLDTLRLGAHAASPPRLQPCLNLPPEADSETDAKPAHLRLVVRVRSWRSSSVRTDPPRDAPPEKEGAPSNDTPENGWIVILISLAKSYPLKRPLNTIRSCDNFVGSMSLTQLCRSV